MLSLNGHVSTDSRRRTTTAMNEQGRRRTTAICSEQRQKKSVGKHRLLPSIHPLPPHPPPPESPSFPFISVSFFCFRTTHPTMNSVQGITASPPIRTSNRKAENLSQSIFSISSVGSLFFFFPVDAYLRFSFFLGDGDDNAVDDGWFAHSCTYERGRMEK